MKKERKLINLLHNYLGFESDIDNNITIDNFINSLINNKVQCLVMICSCISGNYRIPLDRYNLTTSADKTKLINTMIMTISEAEKNNTNIFAIKCE